MRTGQLHTELAPDARTASNLTTCSTGSPAPACITFANETFTNPEGNVIPYRKAALTHEGREQSEAASLGVLLRADTAAPTSARKRRDRVASSTEKITLTPAQQALEANLRAWRKEEAGKTGKPAFIVFGDAALNALIQAAPRSIPELLTVSGFRPAKVERYGTDILAVIRGESPQRVPPDQPRQSSMAAVSPGNMPRNSGGYKDRGPVLLEEPIRAERSPIRPQAALSTSIADPARALSPSQQGLEQRLRDWRKSESERIGLPQFFVLGTTTLRSIVLQCPRTLDQLKSIQGIDPEKLQRFGSSILALCNT